MIDPYVRLDFKDGKKLKIRFTKKGLEQIRGLLAGSGLPIINAKHAYHRP